MTKCNRSWRSNHRKSGHLAHRKFVKCTSTAADDHDCPIELTLSRAPPLWALGAWHGHNVYDGTHALIIFSAFRFKFEVEKVNAIDNVAHRLRELHRGDNSRKRPWYAYMRCVGHATLTYREKWNKKKTLFATTVVCWITEFDLCNLSVWWINKSTACGDSQSLAPNWKAKSMPFLLELRLRVGSDKRRLPKWNRYAQMASHAHPPIQYTCNFVWAVHCHCQPSSPPIDVGKFFTELRWYKITAQWTS